METQAWMPPGCPVMRRPLERLSRCEISTAKEVPMLILARKRGDAIDILPPDSGPIRVVVVEIHRGIVRLGVVADADTEIHRPEWTPRGEGSRDD